MSKLNTKIDRLKKEYSHDDDSMAILKSWEDQIADSSRKARYYEIDLTKDIAKFIQKRIVSIKIKLCSEIGLEREKNLSYHAAIDELKSLLGFYVENADDTIRQIENEVDVELSKL